MKKIKLGGHRYKRCPVSGYALVDDKVFREVSKYLWHLSPDGYPSTNATQLNGKMTLVRMHRFIMQTPHGFVIDHMNGNKLDNRMKNLRVCNQSQNQANRKFLNKNNTSGYRGVSFNKQRKLWSSSIRINYKTIRLGFFKTAKEANQVYKKKAKEMFGDFFVKTNYNEDKI